MKVLMQMSLVLMQASLKKVIRVGRIAGQYAKPRSSDTETRNGVSLPVYRGDIINRSSFTSEDRQPNPELLLRGYERAALTLNFIRALSVGGFADLHHPENWDLDFCKDTVMARQYHQLVESIAESLRFMETVTGKALSETRSVEVYTSHEGLHLPYEQAQTRQVPRRDGWYNLSTHLPWIGYRTAQLDGAHIEYFRGIENPIGCKIGADTKPEYLIRLLEILNPQRIPGRMMLIHRFGHQKIADYLPPLIRVVQGNGHPVLWCADPMHGNTVSSPAGYKTRRFEDIVSELLQAFDIHQQLDSNLGGVHLELTGDNVTECTGGARGLLEQDLHRAYKSLVDPRLNYEQAMEIAFLIAQRLRQNRPAN
jgi:3-deoxy-7-phosphoheptulonate synthase